MMVKALLVIALNNRFNSSAMQTAPISQLEVCVDLLNGHLL